MGTMAFEGYIGTVRELKKREDGDLLLAAALRAFFLWDRMRRANEGEESTDSIEALQQARSEKGRRPSRGRGRDGGGRDGGGRDGGRDGGKDGNKRRRRRRRKGSGGGKDGGSKS